MATTYFIEAAGSDANAGTSAGAGNAWLTIDKAMNTVAAGDTVFVKNDKTYTETATIDLGTNNAGTTPTRFVGYTSVTTDGGRATIDGQSARANCIADSVAAIRVYYVFENFILTGATADGVNISVLNTFWKNCKFDSNAGDGIQAGQCLFESCTFNSNGAHGAHIDSLNSCFIGCKANSNTLDGIHADANGTNLSTVVLFSEFFSNGDDAIEAGQSNDNLVVVVGCTVDGNSKDTDQGLSLGTVIRQLCCCVNNVFYDCTTGVGSQNQLSAVISRNNLVNSNTANYSGFQTTAGEVTSAPTFVNEAAGADYTPNTGSPLIAAGYDAATVAGSTEYMDIGAIQSAGSGSCDYPSEDDVRDAVTFGSGAFTGNVVLPQAEAVQLGVFYDTNSSVAGKEFYPQADNKPVRWHVSNGSGASDSNSGSSPGTVKMVGTHLATNGATGVVTFPGDFVGFLPLVEGETIRIASRTDGIGGSNVFLIVDVDATAVTMTVYPVPGTANSNQTWSVGGPFATVGRAEGLARFSINPVDDEIYLDEAGVGTAGPLVVVPAQADVRNGTAYGEDGTEFTGSLVSGSGGPTGLKTGGQL